MKNLNFTRIILFLFLLIGLLQYSCGLKPPEKQIRVQVVSEDDDSKGLAGAMIVLKKGKKMRSFETLDNGNVTITNILQPPFIMEVSYPKDSDYLPKIVEIDMEKFGSRTSIFETIILEKKTTTIIGKVIDKESLEPVPSITVKLTPGDLIINTEEDGSFSFKSSKIKNGITYTIIFKRDTPIKVGDISYTYEEKKSEITSIDLFKVNDIGEFEIKRLEREASEVIHKTRTVEQGKNEAILE